MRRLWVIPLLAAAMLVPAMGPAAAEPAADAFKPISTGDSGGRVKQLQRLLDWMRYDISPKERNRGSFGPETAAAVRHFQEKFFLQKTGVVTERTWDRLTDLAGTAGKLPPQCRHGVVVCIDLRQKLLRVVNDGTVRRAIDARFGIKGEETRQGMFEIYWKNRDHWSSAYDAPMPFAMFFSGGQAIHFSKYFRADGYYGASHGCVNLRDRKAAKAMFERLPLGTPVYVYRSKPAR